MCNIVISEAFAADTPLRFSWLGKPVSRCGTIIGANFTHCFVYCAEIESQQRTVAALVSFDRPALSASALASRMLSTYPSTFLAGSRVFLRWCHFLASSDL